jgi:DNA-binding winged helix-turn-helix (wHTH) protein
MAVKSLIYQFLDVRVEVSRFRALRAGRTLTLEPKAIETLIFLLDRPGRLIEKDELLSGVWKESFVTPNAMTRIIAQLRRELGDDAKTPHIIQTVPTRGYVFLPEVHRHEEELSRALTGEAALTAVVSAARRVTRTLSGKLRPVVSDEPDEFERAEVAFTNMSECAPGVKANEHSPVGVETDEHPPVVDGGAENNKSPATDIPEPAAPISRRICLNRHCGGGVGDCALVFVEARRAARDRRVAFQTAGRRRPRRIVRDGSDRNPDHQTRRVAPGAGTPFQRRAPLHGT